MVLRTQTTGLQNQLVVSWIPNKITYTKEVTKDIQLFTVHNVMRRKQSMAFNTPLQEASISIACLLDEYCNEPLRSDLEHIQLQLTRLEEDN